MKLYFIKHKDDPRLVPSDNTKLWKRIGPAKSSITYEKTRLEQIINSKYYQEHYKEECKNKLKKLLENVIVEIDLDDLEGVVAYSYD